MSENRDVALVEIRVTPHDASLGKGVDRPAVAPAPVRAFVQPLLRPTAEAWLFWVLFVFPCLVALGVLYGVAADQYTSSAKFVVQANGSQSGFGSLLSTQGLSRAADDTYAVVEYIKSRDAMGYLERVADLRDVFGTDRADILHRFPSLLDSNGSEALYRHYQRFVSADIDGKSGIAELRVRAFSAADAQRLAAALLAGAEAMINDLSQRVHTDYLTFEKSILDAAEARLEGVEGQLSAFRNRQRVVDPMQQSGAAFKLIMDLSAELSNVEASIRQTEEAAPQSPQLTSLRQRAQALTEQIASQRLRVVGDSGSYATMLAEFERLSLSREIAMKALSLAYADYLRAEESVKRRQAYLQVVVAPHVPDDSDYPKRLLWFAAVFALSFCAYRIALSGYRLVMEHA